MHSIVIFCLLCVLSGYMVSLWRLVEYAQNMSAYACSAVEHRHYASALIQYVAYQLSRDIAKQQRIVEKGSLEEEVAAPSVIAAHFKTHAVASYRYAGAVIEITVKLLDEKGSVVAQEQCSVRFVL